MKALTVGGAMIDTIAIIASDRIERMRMTNADNAFLLLEEGRKTEALELSTHVGGGAVNAAVAMARLGLDVGAFVKLGKDARAETVLRVTGSKSEVVHEALPVDDPQVRQPDITRARQLLGWEPKMRFMDGLHRTIDWYFGSRQRETVSGYLQEMLTER